MQAKIDHSVYIHIPFCKHRCGYCDFNTYAGLQDLTGAYVDALVKEIQYSGSSFGENRNSIQTVYFGGGTPSLLPISDVKKIMVALDENFVGLDSAEVSFEVNPGTVDLAYFEGLRRVGINRISMGVQSADVQVLRILEREHGYEDAIDAIKFLKQAGFSNFSIDLIFGVPDQKMESWQHSVELALGLDSPHISLYALTVEHGTPLAKAVNRGLLTEIDDDLAADMYEWTIDHLSKNNFQHYEISNWARSIETQAKHNLQYWHNEPYFGFGAGAHGFVNGIRTANVLAPKAYIDRLNAVSQREYPKTPATVNANKLDKDTEMGETMMMGLRLLEEGISNRKFLERFGRSIPEVYPTELEMLMSKGLLQWGNERLYLTERGKLLGNQVFMEFI